MGICLISAGNPLLVYNPDQSSGDYQYRQSLTLQRSSYDEQHLRRFYIDTLIRLMAIGFEFMMLGPATE